MHRLKMLAWILGVIFLQACATTSGTARDKDGQTLAEVTTQLGIEYMRKGMYEASLDKFKKAIEQDPRLPLAQTSIAVLYERLGEDDLADKHYRKAYNLKNDDSLMLNNYGQFLCRIGRMDEANAMFVTAIRDPLYRFPELVLTNAGMCAEKQPDDEAAEQFYRQALQKNPRYTPALRQMIRLTFAHEQHLATRAYLQRLQEIAPLQAEFLWIGVQTETILGDRNTASSYALLLKNQFPESEQSQALLEWERAQSGR